MKNQRPSPDDLKKSYTQFYELVQKSECPPEMMSAPVVACLSGPSVVIESIVQKAMHETKCEIGWHYVGGRGIVHSKGDKEAIRSALFCAIPQSDLTMGDLRGSTHADYKRKTG